MYGRRTTLKYRKTFAIKDYTCEVHVRVRYLGFSHLIRSCAVDSLYLLLAYKTMMVVVTVFSCVLIYRTVLVKVHWSCCAKADRFQNLQHIRQTMVIRSYRNLLVTKISIFSSLSAKQTSHQGSGKSLFTLFFPQTYRRKTVTWNNYRATHYMIHYWQHV